MARIFCVGHAVEDHIFRISQMPVAPVKYQASDFEIVGGGPAANAAVAIARLGGTPVLCARLGDDPVARSIIRDLEAEHVDCSAVRCFAGRKSSLSSVLIDDDGQRMIVNYLDPDLPTQTDWLQGRMAPDTTAVLADVRWPDGARRCLLEARHRGIPGILDTDTPIPQDGALLAAASHLAFSADGLTAFTGESDLGTALARIGAAFDAWCCVTNGADGVLIQQETEQIRVPAYHVSAVDTLGAGDIWHGAFAWALAAGNRERDAVQYANAAAALKVTRPGGRKGAPTGAELEAFLKTQNTAEDRP